MSLENNATLMFRRRDFESKAFMLGRYSAYLRAYTLHNSTNQLEDSGPLYRTERKVETLL